MINKQHICIGLTSPEHTGKDKFYSVIKSYAFLKGFDQINRFSFADEVRTEVFKHFFNGNSFDLVTASDTKEKIRPLLKSWSELRKTFYGISYWADRFIDYSKTLDTSKKTLTIVTDLSFPIEKEIISEYSDFFISLRLYNEELYKNVKLDFDDPMEASVINRMFMPTDLMYTNDFTEPSMVSIVNKVLDIIEDRTTNVPSESPFFAHST